MVKDSNKKTASKTINITKIDKTKPTKPYVFLYKEKESSANRYASGSLTNKSILATVVELMILGQV